ncbi:MAG: hypothetical protein IPM06_06770 [Rhizobiales bacterium]|nr:hypothetical protein [Hyphomicrobiales bacterium]
MNALKTLSFTAVTKLRRSPVQARRAKLLERLEDQKALIADPNYARTVRRWRKVDGQRTLQESQKRVTPWWTTDDAGQTVLTVRHGLRVLEFEKGKAGIAVGSREKLGSVIDTLISAVKAGELDTILEKAPAAASPRKKA